VEAKQPLTVLGCPKGLLKIIVGSLCPVCACGETRGGSAVGGQIFRIFGSFPQKQLPLVLSATHTHTHTQTHVHHTRTTCHTDNAHIHAQIHPLIHSHMQVIHVHAFTHTRTHTLQRVLL